MLHTWGVSGEGRLGFGLVGVAPADPSSLTRRESSKRRRRRRSIDMAKTEEDEVVSTLTPVPLDSRSDSGDSRAAFVACGSIHSAAISQSGMLYMWGRGKDGRLGNGDADGRFFPTRVAAPLASVAVRHVAVGMRHTVAVTRDGAVYAWGKGKDWQLGTGDADSRETPTLVMDELARERGPVVGCTAGATHSCVFTESGELFGWGTNSAGQLGTGSTDTVKTAAPAAGLGGVRVVEAVASTSHTIVRAASGALYATGDNSFGQLGVGNDDTGPRTTFTAVHGIKDAVSVSTGAKHSLACTAGGQVFAWGNSRWDSPTEDHGQGRKLERMEVATIPVHVTHGLDEGKIVQVSTGSTYSLALSSTGAVWVWGDDSNPTRLDTLGCSATYVSAGVRHAGVILGMKDSSRLMRASTNPDEDESKK